jgi:hypothetical protein
VKLQHSKKEIVDLHNVLATPQTLAHRETKVAGFLDQISRPVRPMQVDSLFPTDQSPPNADCLERLERELRDFQQQFYSGRKKGPKLDRVVKNNGQ